MFANIVFLVLWLVFEVGVSIQFRQRCNSWLSHCRSSPCWLAARTCIVPMSFGPIVIGARLQPTAVIASENWKSAVVSYTMRSRIIYKDLEVNNES